MSATQERKEYFIFKWCVFSISSFLRMALEHHQTKSLLALSNIPAETAKLLKLPADCLSRNMNVLRMLSGLLLGSALSLSIGGLLLYAYNQVPIYLINLTILAVIALFVLAYFVSKGRMLAINVSTVLGVFAPILSASTPAHVAILEEFGKELLLSADGLLQFLGFYLFPITFVILRIAYRKRLVKASTRRKIDASGSPL